jgi:hypothetical protein
MASSIVFDHSSGLNQSQLWVDRGDKQFKYSEGNIYGPWTKQEYPGKERVDLGSSIPIPTYPIPTDKR